MESARDACVSPLGDGGVCAFRVETDIPAKPAPLENGAGMDGSDAGGTVG